jgi:23S rRNA (cytosine1962-C5)-methyltransferase
LTPAIIIKRGREKPIIQQHPWIFSGAIDRVEGNPTPGDIVTVKSTEGKFLARGYWNPKSQIQIRILTWHDEPVDDDWWRRMLKRAIDARLREDDIHHNWESLSCRLINAENDFIPGLVVDFYSNHNAGYWIILQALTLGIDQRKHMIAHSIFEILQNYAGLKERINGIYERSDVDIRRKEGLEEITGVLLGAEPPEFIIIQESEYIFVDVQRGHKTGFYLDQRKNRTELVRLIFDAFSSSSSCKVLNLFSYTGAFGLRAMIDSETIHVTNVDSSYEALEFAERSVKYSGFPLESFDFIQADVFEFLHDQAEAREQYDVIVLDPPKFAHNAQQVEKAARGYKDINLNAFKLVKPGGYLMTFSCSGAISADLFQKIVFGALADSGRQAQILKHLGPGDDHPVALTFPEGAYLKGLLLRVY